MQYLKAIFVVLRQGEVLSDAKAWKDRHQIANAVLAILGVLAPILAHYGIGLSAEDAAAIAGGIAAVGGLVTAYLVPATSTQAGLPPKGGTDDKKPFDTGSIMG